MYYVIAGVLYVAVVILLVLWARREGKPRTATSATAADRPADIREHRRQTHGTFLRQLGAIAVLVAVPLVANLLRYRLLAAFAIPREALYEELGGMAGMLFSTAAFLPGIPPVMTAILAAERANARSVRRRATAGLSRRAYRYTVLAVLSVCLPVLLVCGNSYTYVTEDAVVCKRPLAFTPERYTPADIVSADKPAAQNQPLILHMSDGRQVPLYPTAAFSPEEWAARQIPNSSAGGKEKSLPPVFCFLAKGIDTAALTC